jgi:hypothetical protein
VDNETIWIDDNFIVKCLIHIKKVKTMHSI